MNEINITNAFNDYFPNIGANLAKLLNSFKNVKVEFSSKTVQNSLFLAPTTEHEIADLISLLNNKKAKRINDIEIKCLKFSKSIIAPTLSELFNLAILKGIFPIVLKWF